MRCICRSEHELDDAGSYVIWNGVKEFAPFYCACCKAEICSRQYAYGKMCGNCDTGQCGQQHWWNDEYQRNDQKQGS